MKRFTRIFLRGLLAILPIFLTLYLVVWSFMFLESSLSGLLQYVLPESMYFPGLGLLVLFSGVFLTGLALSEIHLKQTFQFLEKRFSRLPVIKSIYGICKDFLGYFANHRRRKEFNQVVTVKMPLWDFKLVGFITDEDLARHNERLGEENWVAVYLPMGYQIGGYTLLMDRRHVEPIDMSFEDAMRFILTAGVASRHEGGTAPPFVPESAGEERDSAKAEGVA
ncbi:DUF502 domain-containing protein [Cerasicoccus arenae]|uniref:Membrane protein n=1 Tax=Cerasicoccus arenae TaxID=424488 RepID=A0A8J3GCZ5_9BACT|nr:DUF502 domain-containing protein [Cerasicoccus arenae]MBK1858449.1 DUF502 domain-containing protein [Cerasicoccus arenae]GHC02637.1 membrane protein [Cerasicoccus arenae]